MQLTQRIPSMKIKQIISTSLFALSTLAVASSTAFADQGNYRGQANGHKMCKQHDAQHGGAKHNKKGNMHGMKYMAEALGLSDEQKTKITAIKKEKRDVMQSIRKQMHEIKRKLTELDPKSPNFKTDIFSLAAQKGTLTQRMVVEKGEKQFKIASVLTQEQLAKKKEMRKHKKPHMCNHRGCKHGGKHKSGHHSKLQCKHPNKNLKNKSNRAKQEIKRIKEI